MLVLRESSVNRFLEKSTAVICIKQSISGLG